MVRSGPTEITLLENERWASPVNDEIKQAVHVELARRLDLMTGPQPAFTRLTLDIDVKSLEAELGRYALLEASWSATVTAADGRLTDRRITRCTFRAEENIRSGYAGIVEGYQREIAALADAVAAAVTDPASNIEAPCQKTIQDSAGGSGSKDH
jgi:uncharacterized lipoprotein YmbA